LSSPRRAWVRCPYDATTWVCRLVHVTTTALWLLVCQNMEEEDDERHLRQRDERGERRERRERRGVAPAAEERNQEPVRENGRPLTWNFGCT
jgi:hypothetical protein